jgi:hypothetical protein
MSAATSIDMHSSLADLGGRSDTLDDDLAAGAIIED